MQFIVLIATEHQHVVVSNCKLVFTGIVKTLCEGIAKYCPKAWVAIISNPVNSTVPIAAEVFKKYVSHCSLLFLAVVIGIHIILYSTLMYHPPICDLRFNHRKGL